MGFDLTKARQDLDNARKASVDDSDMKGLLCELSLIVRLDQGSASADDAARLAAIEAEIGARIIKMRTMSEADRSNPHYASSTGEHIFLVLASIE